MDLEIKKHNEDMERFGKLKEAAEALRTELRNPRLEEDKIAVVTKEKVVFYSNTLSIPKEAYIKPINTTCMGQK